MARTRWDGLFVRTGDALRDAGLPYWGRFPVSGASGGGEPQLVKHDGKNVFALHATIAPLATDCFATGIDTPSLPTSDGAIDDRPVLTW